MKKSIQDLQYYQECLWEDLLKCYLELSTKKDINTRLLINNHKKLLNRTALFGKNKDKTLKLLNFFVSTYHKNKPQALQLFMCTLNNKGILNKAI